MRIAQGVDIVYIEKFRRVYDRHPAFREDVFSDKEREYCHSLPDPYPYLAGRFAAKEACLKALGVGLGGDVSGGLLSEIEILQAHGGRIEMRLTGWTERLSRRLHPGRLNLSISLSGEYAISTVMIECDGYNQLNHASI